ncbi:hypothetical protein NL372_30500, partial [Klebsiella pneumoniae]|nr:hypothetical protein [Klebsiella pneumoniae]
KALVPLPARDRATGCLVDYFVIEPNLQLITNIVLSAVSSAMVWPELDVKVPGKSILNPQLVGNVRIDELARLRK